MPPTGEGVNSVYTNEHLERLLLIKKLQSEYMPLNKIREIILENPKGKRKIRKTKKDEVSEKSNIYFRENICNIFEIHYTKENSEKYGYIIENIKKYVEKMMED